jgi:hypothetical protein
VAGGVEDEFADELAGVVVEHADVEVVDEDGDFGAAALLAKADVVRAAVVADCDDAGGVDAVGAYPAAGGDFVARGGGFGAGVECGLWGFVAVGLGVVGWCCSRRRLVDLGLQFGDCRRCREGPSPPTPNARA